MGNANVTSGYIDSVGLAGARTVTGKMSHDNFQPAFSEAIAWREYAQYLENRLCKFGFSLCPIAGDVLRTTPPRKTTGWE